MILHKVMLERFGEVKNSCIQPLPPPKRDSRTLKRLQQRLSKAEGVSFRPAAPKPELKSSDHYPYGEVYNDGTTESDDESNNAASGAGGVGARGVGAARPGGSHKLSGTLSRGEVV